MSARCIPVDLYGEIPGDEAAPPCHSTRGTRARSVLSSGLVGLLK